MSRRDAWALVAFWIFFACRVEAATMALESAAMGPTGQAIGPPVSATSFVGWRFRVTAPTAITEVGGHLGAINGNLFAAIISLTALDAMPQGAPFADGTVKASTTFTPPSPSAEFRTPLATQLAPGSYALIFGSGLFNANGSAMAAINSQPNVAPTTQASYVFWKQTLPGVFNWVVGDSNNIRFVVVGSELAGPTDFNLDGKIDSNDLPVWKAGFGGSAPAGVANGDANGDGKVDGADFLLWQRSQSDAGPPSAPAAAVSEPAGATMLMLLAAPLLSRRVVRRRIR
jgi:hypothetical protein